MKRVLRQNCFIFLLLSVGIFYKLSYSLNLNLIYEGKISESIEINDFEELQNEIYKITNNYSWNFIYLFKEDGSFKEIKNYHELKNLEEIDNKNKLYLALSNTPYDLNNENNILPFYSIIIAGTGLAGCSSAVYSAKKSTHSILLLEKKAELGGNSRKASSGINFIDTPLQKNQNINDSIKSFIKDTINSGKGKSNIKLVEELAKNSQKAYNFLEDIGINFKSLAQLGGHSINRTHRPENGGVGEFIMSKVISYITNYPTKQNLQLKTKSELFELIEKNNQIIGVKIKYNGKEINVYCNSVILATGGYANDHNNDSLLSEYAPHLIQLPTTNGNSSDGSGIKLARKIGAALVDMDQLQIHPTSFIDPINPEAKVKFLAHELLRGVGGILINEKGNRFCNELGYRDYITEEIFKHCRNATSYLLINEEGMKKYGQSFNYYIEKGFIKHYKNLADLCKSTGLDYINLLNTFEQYNISSNNSIDEFGKKIFPERFDPDNELYSCIITPALHYSMGGVKINKKAEVISSNGKVIRGLYAAGEVTGGVHGGNRLAGNSLFECVTFGIIAAENAIKFSESKAKCNLFSDDL